MSKWLFKYFYVKTYGNIFYSSCSKVFIEFPMSNVSDMMYTNELHGSQLVPGNICFGVYIALKMSKLRTEFKIPLMK